MILFDGFEYHIIPWLCPFTQFVNKIMSSGFPKMGTSSLHAFFKCGNLTSTHFRCGPATKCASCMKKSVEANLPPLAKCAQADMYAQIDDAIYFPQIELLEEIVQGHPNATFFLTFRSMEKWYHSITHWPPRPKGPHMSDRMKKFNITGSPNLDDNDPEDFYDWYCNHVQRVRDIVARNPSHTLVEVDIEDPTVGQRMEDMFGIEKSCWGHANVNAYIHPELNESEVEVSKHFRRKDKSHEKKEEGTKRQRRRQSDRQTRMT